MPRALSWMVPSLVRRVARRPLACAPKRAGSAAPVRGEASIDALVEKHPHDAFAIIRAVASSRKATICSRVPVQALIDYLEGGETIDDFLAGFPTEKSSIVSPPSR